MQSAGFDFLTLFSTTKSQTADQAMADSSTQKSAIKNAFKLLFQQMLGKGVQVSSDVESGSQDENPKKNVGSDSDETTSSYLVHGQLVQMNPQKQQKIKTLKNQTDIMVDKDAADHSDKKANAKNAKTSTQNIMQSENSIGVDGSLVQGETSTSSITNAAGQQEAKSPIADALIQGNTFSSEAMNAEGKVVNKNQAVDSSAKLVGKMGNSEKNEQKNPQQINLSNKSEKASEIAQQFGQTSKMKSKMDEPTTGMKQLDEEVKQSVEKNATNSTASAMKSEHMQTATLNGQLNSEMKKVNAIKKEQSEGNKETAVDDVKKNADVDKVKIATETSNSQQKKNQSSENGEKQFKNLADKSAEMKVEAQTTSQKTTSENKAETAEFQVKSETKSEAVQFGATSKTVADHVENLNQRPVQFAEQVTSVAEKSSSSAVLREPIAEQVAPAVARMIRGNHSKMTLTLKPQELGALKIELQSQQGVVGAKFLVESQEVRQLVENSLPELKSMMERQGIQVESVEVEVRTNSDGATSSQTRFARNGNSNGQSPNQNQQGGYRHEQQTDDPEQNWKRPSRQYGYNSVEYIA